MRLGKDLTGSITDRRSRRSRGSQQRKPRDTRERHHKGKKEITNKTHQGDKHVVGEPRTNGKEQQRDEGQQEEKRTYEATNKEPRWQGEGPRPRHSYDEVSSPHYTRKEGIANSTRSSEDLEKQTG